MNTETKKAPWEKPWDEVAKEMEIKLHLANQRVQELQENLLQEQRNRVAACATLTKDCNLRGKYIRQLREAILKMPAQCTCTTTVCVFGHDENCPAKIQADALKLKDDVAEPANNQARARQD